MLERKTYGSEQYEIRFCIGDFLYGHSRDVVKKDIAKSVYPCTVNIANYALMAYLNQHSVSCLSVYRAKAIVDENRDTSANPNIVTPWYQTMEEVNAHLDRMGFTYSSVTYSTGNIYHRKVFPVTYPKDVILKKNDRGYYTRIELEPEKTGKTDDEGMFFFPDTSSQKVVCEGPAIVRRTFNRPGSTYGFMKVEMKKWTAPSMAAVAEYMLGIANAQNLKIPEVGWYVHRISSIFGEAVWVYDAIRHIDFTLTLDEETGKVSENCLLENYLDYSKEGNLPNSIRFLGEKPDHISDLICQWKFGCTFVEMKAQFNALKLPYHEMINQIANEGGESSSIISSYIRQGYPIQDKFVRTNVNTNIHYIDMDDTTLWHIIRKRNSAEKNIFFSDCAVINRAAIAALRNCGRLPKEDSEYGVV